jgi:hypothetical protein
MITRRHAAKGSRLSVLAHTPDISWFFNLTAIDLNSIIPSETFEIKYTFLFGRNKAYKALPE